MTNGCAEATARDLGLDLPEIRERYLLQAQHLAQKVLSGDRHWHDFNPKFMGHQKVRHPDLPVLPIPNISFLRELDLSSHVESLQDDLIADICRYLIKYNLLNHGMGRELIRALIVNR